VVEKTGRKSAALFFMLALNLPFFTPRTTALSKQVQQVVAKVKEEVKKLDEDKCVCVFCLGGWDLGGQKGCVSPTLLSLPLPQLDV
jgi:hypothetical protein